MTRQERFAFTIKYFQEVLPDPETELRYDNPYQLLVAVILSAQCTDKRVNMTTPALFARYPDMASLARAESLGGTRMMGPETVMEGVVIGLFQDPEGHTVGVVNSA